MSSCVLFIYSPWTDQVCADWNSYCYDWRSLVWGYRKEPCHSPHHWVWLPAGPGLYFQLVECETLCQCDCLSLHEPLVPPSLPPPLQDDIKDVLFWVGFVYVLCFTQSSSTLTVQSSSPFDPSMSPSLSGGAQPRACRGPPPPGHQQPVGPPLALDGSIPPCPIILDPALTLWRPSAPAWTFGHSGSPGSLGQLATHESVLVTPPPRT